METLLIKNIASGEYFKKNITHNELEESFLDEILSYNTETFKWNDKKRHWEECEVEYVGDCKEMFELPEFKIIYRTTIKNNNLEG